jgi:hypothetical protein
MQFYREASLRIDIRREDLNGFEPNPVYIRDLRISFEVHKLSGWSTNKAIIKVYNLSAEHRNLIKDFGNLVYLYAGYTSEGDSQLLFKGYSTAIIHSYHQQDIITTIECGDGDRILNDFRISVSFDGEVAIQSVIEQIAFLMEYKIDKFPSVPNLAYQTGFQFCGMAKEGLSKACDALGLNWSVQNDLLQLTPRNGWNGKAVSTISAETGMIGIPERYTYRRLQLYADGPKTGWRINSVLRPEIIPESRIKLISKNVDVNGIFVVYMVRHYGDTYGPDWRSNLEVIIT